MWFSPEALLEFINKNSNSKQRRNNQHSWNNSSKQSLDTISLQHMLVAIQHSSIRSISALGNHLQFGLDHVHWSHDGGRDCSAHHATCEYGWEGSLLVCRCQSCLHYGNSGEKHEREWHVSCKRRQCSSIESLESQRFHNIHCFQRSGMCCIWIGCGMMFGRRRRGACKLHLNLHNLHRIRDNDLTEASSSTRKNAINHRQMVRMALDAWGPEFPRIIVDCQFDCLFRRDAY